MSDTFDTQPAGSTDEGLIRTRGRIDRVDGHAGGGTMTADLGAESFGDPNHGAGQLGIPMASVQAGRYHNADGETEYGVTGGARTATWQRNTAGALDPVAGGWFNVAGVPGYVRGDGPSASAGVTVNAHHAQIGAQYQSGSAEVGLGQGDNRVRFGLSAGGGGAFRLHYGDSDHNGYNSFGFGLDAGPVSLDVQGENPHSDFSDIVAADEEGRGVPEHPASPTESADARRVRAAREHLRQQRAQRRAATQAAANPHDAMNRDPVALQAQHDQLVQRAATHDAAPVSMGRFTNIATPGGAEHPSLAATPGVPARLDSALRAQRALEALQQGRLLDDE